MEPSSGIGDGRWTFWSLPVSLCCCWGHFSCSQNRINAGIIKMSLGQRWRQQKWQCSVERGIS